MCEYRELLIVFIVIISILRVSKGNNHLRKQHRIRTVFPGETFMMPLIYSAIGLYQTYTQGILTALLKV